MVKNEMIIFLFGQIGAGKSFVGRLIERKYGISFHDADEDLTDTMREAIARHAPLTPEMRREFTDVLRTRIHQLGDRYGTFCVAQGFFKNEQRARLQAEFSDLRFVWVRAHRQTIKARLERRVGHVADLEYAEFANPHFETPTMPHTVLINEEDESSVLRQLGKEANHLGFLPTEHTDNTEESIRHDQRFVSVRRASTGECNNG